MREKKKMFHNLNDPWDICQSGWREESARTMAAGGRGKKNGNGDPSPEDSRGREDLECCPTERDIEHLVLGRMGGTRMGMLLEHIGFCFTCNETYQAFSYFYQRANREKVPEGAYPGMATLPPHPLSDFIVNLEPVHLPEPGAEDPDVEEEETYSRLCTCSCASERVRGTLMLDRGSGEVIVRLEGAGKRSVRHITVLVESLREKVLTDARGIAALGVREPAPLMDTRLRICFPLIRLRTTVGVDLNQEELFNPGPLPGFPVESVWVYVDDENALCLELAFSTEDDDHRRFTAACFGKGRPMMVPVLGGIGVFRNVSLGSPLLISVFPN